MIARCGLRTRLRDARSGAGLAGAARPLQRHQGCRDSDAASRGRGAAPDERPASADLARPRGAQRAGQAVACPAAPAEAGVAPNAAALACSTRCPQLDLPAPTAAAAPESITRCRGRPPPLAFEVASWPSLQTPLLLAERAAHLTARDLSVEPCGPGRFRSPRAGLARAGRRQGYRPR